MATLGLLFESVRFLVACLLFAFAALVALANWTCFLRNYRNRRLGVERRFSIVPALSFILAVVAGLVWPRGPGVWIAVPVILDPGTWLAVALPFLMLRAWFFPKG